MADNKKSWEEAKANVSKDHPDIKEFSDGWHSLVMKEYKKIAGLTNESRSIKEVLQSKNPFLVELYERTK